MSDYIDTTVLAPNTFSQAGAGGGIVTGQAANTSATAAATTPAPGTPDVGESLQRVNEHLATTNRVLELRVDAETRTTVATILNSNTGEVLQQYPSENSLHLAQMLAAWSHGRDGLLNLIA